MKGLHIHGSRFLIVFLAGFLLTLAVYASTFAQSSTDGAAEPSQQSELNLLVRIDDKSPEELAAILRASGVAEEMITSVLEVQRQRLIDRQSSTDNQIDIKNIALTANDSCNPETTTQGVHAEPITLSSIFKASTSAYESGNVTREAAIPTFADGYISTTLACLNAAIAYFTTSDTFTFTSRFTWGPGNKSSQISSCDEYPDCDWTHIVRQEGYVITKHEVEGGGSGIYPYYIWPYVICGA